MSDVTQPITPFQLTQGFGENPQNYKRFGLAGHNGWDYRTMWPDTPEGHRNIICSFRSKLYKIGDEGNDGYGKYFQVLIQLSSLWQLTYAHCLPGTIEQFNEKLEGDILAISDTTGNVTGPHLHLTTKRVIANPDGTLTTENYGNGYFGAVDPQQFFDELKTFKETGGVTSMPNTPQTIEVLMTDFNKIRDNSETLDHVTDYLGEPRNSQWSVLQIDLDHLKNKAPVTIPVSVPSTDAPNNNGAGGTIVGNPTPAPSVPITVSVGGGIPPPPSPSTPEPIPPTPSEKKHVDYLIGFFDWIFNAIVSLGRR